MQQPQSPNTLSVQQQTNGGSTTSSLSPSHSTHSFATSSHHSSSEPPLEEKYADTSLYPIPMRFDKLIPLEERYITHATFLKNRSSETTFIGLLTNNRFYKVDPDTNKRAWSIDIVDIHSVEGEESIDPKMLKLVYHIRPSSSSTTTSSSTGGTNGNSNGNSNGNNDHYGHGHHDSNNPEPSPPDSPNMSGGGSLHRLGQLTATALKRATNSSDSNFIGEKVMIAESEDIRDQWLIAIRLLMRNYFQKMFEQSFIPAPAIYQIHLYVYKTNRKGKNQIRCILISTERFYNISVKQTLELGKVKWSFPINAMKNVQVFKSPSNLLVVNIDNKENTKVKETQQFILRDIYERNLVVNELKRLYNRSTKQYLTKEEKDEIHLKKSTLLNKLK